MSFEPGGSDERFEADFALTSSHIAIVSDNVRTSCSLGVTV